MAPRTTYANLQDGLAPFSLWDQSLADMGSLGIIPCTALGTNPVVLTPVPSVNAPNVTAYQPGMTFSFLATGSSSGPIKVGSLASIPLAGANTITSGYIYILMYVGGSFYVAGGNDPIAASLLPAPTLTTLGGVKANNVASHQWVSQIDTTGTPQTSQPAFSDISGTAASAQLPTPTTSLIGGVKAINAVSHQWVQSIDTTGTPQLAQPAFSDISGSAAASQSSFTQTGTGAVSVTLDGLYRNRVFTPEMFGAVPSPLGTAAGSIADSTAAVQAAINALAALGGGTLQFGPGAYAITSVTISTNNIFIRGAGLNATTIVHKLSSPSSCFVFSAGVSVLSNTGISDLSIGSNDTVITKIAINVSDVSFFYIRNVSVAHYFVDGTLYRASGGTGTALFIQGREHGVIENFQCYAEQPIHIGVNPNSSISLDSWVFRKCVLVSNTPAQPGPYHVITIDTNVNIFNLTFDGQNWIGGNDELHWVDTTSTQISTGLFISNIKSEQSAASGASGYTVHIEHNTGLENLKIDGVSGGDRALTKLRKVNSATIANGYFDPVTGTGTNTVAFDLDNTDLIVNVRNCIFTNVGGRASSTSITGLTTVYSDGVVGSFTAIPPNITYSSSSTLSTLNGASIDNVAWTSYLPLLSSEAGGAIGTGNTLTGFYKQIGKTVHVTISITTGASGIGTATQFGVTIPVTAKRDCILVGRNRTTGLGEVLDIGTLSLSRGLFQTAAGGAGIANSNVVIITGTYEAA